MRIYCSNNTRQYKEEKHLILFVSFDIEFKNFSFYSIHLQSSIRQIVSLLIFVTVKCFKNKLEIQPYINFFIRFFFLQLEISIWSIVWTGCEVYYALINSYGLDLK